MDDQFVVNGSHVIVDEELLKHTTVLASREYDGRYPGTDGEIKTVKYLVEEFTKAGATTTTKQTVPLVKITPQSLSDLKLSVGDKSIAFTSPDEFVASTSIIDATEFSVNNSEVIFVGYGIHSVQYSWNDFDGLPENLAGKTLICLVNDPGFATNDTTLFNGRAVTYSGRWTYKYEEAGRRGADAIFIVHNTEAAGYPWSVVKTGRLEPSLKVDSTAKGEDKCQIEGWLTEDSARSLFSAAGLSFDEVKAKASKRGFKPISLSNTKVNDLRLATSLNRIKSDNVIAVLDGADTKEVVVFTAHWDHFGVSQDGKCYHGARDNALGCAALISLTKAFASIPKEKRQRSVMFLVPTGEESGLLGSLFYVQNPIFSMNDTIACINFDIMNIFGRTHDVTFYGRGGNELDDLADEAAAIQKRRVDGDPTPENGMFYRSDHFNFAKMGVPALFINMGFDHVERGKEYLLKKQIEWTAKCYHKELDQVYTDPEHPWCWDLSGATEDVQLVFMVAAKLVTNQTLRPKWRPTNEFAKVRGN